MSEELILKAAALWALLDDIDTMDDVAKSDDKLFRNRVRELQRKRFEVLTGDEFDQIVKDYPIGYFAYKSLKSSLTNPTVKGT